MYYIQEETHPHSLFPLFLKATTAVTNLLDSQYKDLLQTCCLKMLYIHTIAYHTTNMYLYTHRGMSQGQC